MMNLSEIGLKQNIKSIDDARAILHYYKWEVLGSGIGGAVAQHPKKPYVLKLFTRDPGYKLFLKFIQENEGNRHLPRINRQIRQIPGTEYYYVRMERLTPISLGELYGLYQPEGLFFAWLARDYGIRIGSSSAQELDK